MDYDLFYSLIISLAGASLFLLVDRYERNRLMAALLKFLLVFVSGVIVIERLHPYWLSLF
jgi:hypothetical protein